MSRLRFYEILVFLFIVGLMLMALDVGSWTISEYLKSLPIMVVKVGEALIIAVILAGTVDAFIKRRLGDEIAKDISPFIAAAALPAELQGELRELSVCNVYRSSLTLHYKIVPEEQHDDLVRISTAIRYQAINVSRDPAKHIHSVTVQKQQRVNVNIKQITYVKAAGVANKGGYDLEPSEDTDGLTATPYTVRWEREVSIPGMGAANFAAQVCQILPRNNFDMFVWTQP